MSENEYDPSDGEIIGHVMGDDEDAVTVCADCYEGGSDGAIRDDTSYGIIVPYPECWVCGEVMRPDSE